MKVFKFAVSRAVLYYLRFWAKLSLAINKPRLIGIAGSVGKSSTRNAVAAVLSNFFPIRIIETNSETGLPLGILGMKPHDYSPLDWVSMLLRAPFGITHVTGAKYLVIEMGIDDPYPPKNMEYLLSIVHPQIGIITYESAAHTLQFAKAVEKNTFASDRDRQDALINAITAEDLKLLTNPACRIGIVNADVAPLLQAARAVKSMSLQIYTFGSATDASIRTVAYRVTPGGTVFGFSFGNNETVTLEFPHYCFPEEYQGTFAASLLLAYVLGLDISAAKNALLKGYRPPPGRAGIFEGIHQSTILDSSYNASKPTDLAFLRLLGALKQDTRRPAVAIIADMLELGPQEKMEHEEVARAIPGSADYVWLVGALTKTFILPILENSSHIREVKWFASADALNEYVQSHLPQKAVVLVKGSQGQLWLEESIKLLLKNKGDSQYLCRQNAFWQKVKKRAGRWVEA